MSRIGNKAIIKEQSEQREDIGKAEFRARQKGHGNQAFQQERRKPQPRQNAERGDLPPRAPCTVFLHICSIIILSRGKVN